MPSFWTHVTRGLYAESSNWAAFAAPLTVDGAVGVLHVPVREYNPSAPASVCGTMTVFRPRTGNVGVAVGESRELLRAVAASGMMGERLGIQQSYRRTR